MSQESPRTFSREFKVKVVERIEAGESISKLSGELSIKRSILYRWRDAYRVGGAPALRGGRGRPTLSDAAEMAAARQEATGRSDPSKEQHRIAELERKIGQQQMDIDFFKEALRRIEASHRPNDGPGVTASSRASKR